MAAHFMGVSEKKDLTDLNDLFPTTPDSGSSGASSLNFDLPPTSENGEGLDDFLSPMAPGEVAAAADSGPSELSAESAEEAFSTYDPLESLPPMDPEIARIAAGETLGENPNEEILEIQPALPDEPPPESLLDTPIGAAIHSALSPDPSLSPSEHAPNMADLKNYSEKIASTAGPSAAATPFSLMIVGALQTHEREALVQILSRESLGIREVELEPQFEAGRILIPRISEYAGVLIVQTLRNSNAKMHLGPSERIFVARDADDGDSLIFADQPESEILVTEAGESSASHVILVPESAVPNRKTAAVLDTLHAAMNLRAADVAQTHSSAFQGALDKLKQQLRFQAHHRGADALVSFKYELHSLEGQTVYKLVVQAMAVRLA